VGKLIYVGCVRACSVGWNWDLFDVGRGWNLNLGWMLKCADTWLSKNSVCPICRAKLQPQVFDPPEDDHNPC